MNADDHDVHSATASDTSRTSDHGTERSEVPATLAPPRRRRGFAAMDPALVSEISRKGGKAAHEKGTAHEFTPEEAREAGRKGGRATHAAKRLTNANATTEPTVTPPDEAETSPEGMDSKH